MDVMRLPISKLQATDATRVFNLDPKQALWIRITLPAAVDEQRWYLKVATPGLDQVDLYTRSSTDQWTVQKAGDRLAVADWPLPNLYPVFPLIVSAENPTYYAIRIRASDSFTAPIVFENESRLSTSQQKISLLHGVYFGLLMMVSLFAFSTAVTMRDTSHAFFGLWTAILTLSIASVVGVGGIHLWSRAAAWNDSAEYVLPVLSLAPLMIFVAQAISLHARKAWLYWCFVFFAVSFVCTAASLQVLPEPARVYVAYGSCAASALLCMVAIAWAFSMGDRFAGWLFAGFTPLLVLLLEPLARRAGWIQPQIFSQLAGQVAVGIALPAILLMLMLRNQERRNYQRRISQIDRIDPATGLVNDLVFVHRLRSQIERSEKLNHLSLVVVVDIANRSKILESFGRRIWIELILRLAQRLSIFLRDVDTVARLGDARFGLLIEGPIAVDRVNNMATKIMARCVDPFSGLPAALNIKPKIALAAVPLHGSTPEGVMAKLDVLLMEASPDYRKNIFMASDMDLKPDLITSGT